MVVSLEDTISLQGPALKCLVDSIGPISTFEELYLCFRHHYLIGDVDALQTLLVEGEKIIQSLGPWAEALLHLRLSIRMYQPLACDPEVLFRLFSELESEPWRGEALMVLAMYNENFNQDRRAETLYRLSSSAFRRAGYMRKSMIARYNCMAARTRIEPQKKYFYDQQVYVQEAVKHRFLDLAGVASLNLSREFQLVGAYQLALRHSSQAVELCRQYDFGSLQYYLALAQHLNVMLILNQWSQATSLFEELSVAPFREVEEIQKVITNYLNRDVQKEAAYTHLPLTWRERMTNLMSPEVEPLTEKESELVEILTKSPAEIHEIATRIYGENISYESGVARTKQLLHRLRRKRPNLVQFSRGLYSLA